MLYRWLARSVAALHAAFVAFVVFGGLLVLRWPSVFWVHAAAVVWAAATLAFDLGCPLTPAEKECWRRGGREPYAEGFLQHHFLRREFSPAAGRRWHLMLGAGVLLLNVLLYAILAGIIARR